MLLNYLGEIAALLASICFAIGPTFNTLATRLARVSTVNRARLIFTFLLLLLPHWLMQGSVFPTTVHLNNLFWLGLSGLFALVLGDTLLFEAFSRIGTRLSMLIISLIPVISSVLAWFILDEKLSWIQSTGIFVTITGIIWVVSDRKNGSSTVAGRSAYLQGISMAVGSAFLHSIGNITAKLGLAGEIPAISGHLLRVGLALLILMLLMLIKGEFKSTIKELASSRVTMKYILIGAFFGPMLGSGLMMVALENTNVGIASLLTSLSPVWLLPVGRYYFQEKIGLRAVAGSLVAVIGVVILFVL